MAPHSLRARALYLSALAGVAGKQVTIAAIYNNDDGYSLTALDIKDLQALEEKEQAFERLRASSTSRGGGDVTSTVMRSGDYGPSARGSVKPDL